MDRKMRTKFRGKSGFLRFFRPSMRFYYAVLVVFCIVAFAFGHWKIGLIEAALTALLLIYTRAHRKRQKRELLEYVGSTVTQLQDGTSKTILGIPLPMVIFNLKNGLILWSNDEFLRIAGDREHIFEVAMSDLLPGFSLNWLAEGRAEAPEPVTLENRIYRVYGNVYQMERDRVSDGYWGMCYFADVTTYEQVSREYTASRPVSAVIMLDNYDELLKNVSEAEKSTLLAQIDKRISAWCAPTGGYLCRYDRDRYIFIFEERYMQGFIDDKFSLLDSVRELQSSTGIAATLSIGAGRGAQTLAEGYQSAMLAIDMSLSRGGDQAVIKTPATYAFYGGSNQAIEKRTKVKSRVMASALSDMIGDSSNLLIMGHKEADLDCIGSAVALCCISRKMGKAAHIVIDREKNVSKQLIERLRKLPEYADVFIEEQEALLYADARTLLIVVDTNRPDQVESQTLLSCCSKIAVVDHHRRAVDYIMNAALNFHEPYASSASELATELLQYLVDTKDILKLETEAVLSGIALDTKNFTTRTGSRTFEAAAFLRRCGADTTEVKKLLQNDLEKTVQKYAIIQQAREFRPGIVIAECASERDRVLASQAADELVNISGVDTSFVIYGGEDSVNISARSIGAVSVQIILEKLGGGGNRSQAGAQVRDKDSAQVCAELEQIIDDYLDNNEDGTEGLK